MNFVLSLAAVCAANMAIAQSNDLVSVTFVCEGGIEVPVFFVKSESSAYAVA